MAIHVAPSHPPVNEKEADTRKKDEKAKEIQMMDEHRIDLEELCERYGTDLERGLPAETASKRNLEEGDNKLP